MKFTGYKENEMEMSDEIVKLFEGLGCGIKDMAQVMDVSEVFINKVKKRQVNLSPQQIMKLIKRFGAPCIDPPKRSTEKEKRLYAALTTIIKHLYRAIV